MPRALLPIYFNVPVLALTPMERVHDIEMTYFSELETRAQESIIWHFGFTYSQLASPRCYEIVPSLEIQWRF